LGLEAQQAALVRFAEAEGFDLVQTFEEVETGKGADALNRRPQLAAALKAAKKIRSPIILAKLDRLSRDVHFIGSSPLGVVSPNIGPVNDILAPLIDLDQDNADANGQRRKYGDLDQHLGTKCFA
jgi:hypothetical protein